MQYVKVFFANVNKSSILTTVSEQTKAAVPSTSFIMVADNYNVDVPGPNN